jgi:hypothetical protein
MRSGLIRPVAAAIASAVIVSVACRGGANPLSAAPATDFLLAAGDSTFWVTTGAQGVRVRGSPLVLAHYDGRFYEVYVADEDHSFYDAVFTTQRIYRRDLLTGDSAAVFRDSAVLAAARVYAVRHPNEAPLASDEDASEDPATSIMGEVDIVDVHGPYLSFEYRRTTDIARNAGTAKDSEATRSNRETLHRGVVDLRTGQRATLRGLFGAAAAETASSRGRLAFAAAVDSVRAVRAGGGERARLAAAAIRDFSFDPSSFTVSDLDQEPAVQFFAPGDGPRGSGLILPLPTIHLSGMTDPAWWDAERASLPVGGPDSASDVWARRALEVVGRYDTARGPLQGQGVMVSLRESRNNTSPGKGGGTRPAPDAREWRVGRFPAPTRRLYWLDVPTFDSASRRALLRAFDESALYGDETRSARLPMNRLNGKLPRLAFAALQSPRLRPRAKSATRDRRYR